MISDYVLYDRHALWIHKKKRAAPSSSVAQRCWMVQWVLEFNHCETTPKNAHPSGRNCRSRQGWIMMKAVLNIAQWLWPLTSVHQRQILRISHRYFSYHIPKNTTGGHDNDIMTCYAFGALLCCEPVLLVLSLHCLACLTTTTLLSQEGGARLQLKPILKKIICESPCDSEAIHKI